LRFKVVLAIPLLVAFGCGENYGKIPVNNIVMVNAEGHPVDPTGNTSCEEDGRPYCNGAHTPLIEYPLLGNDQYLHHIDAIAGNLRSGGVCGKDSVAHSYLQQRIGSNKPPRILIFLHGGLNTQAGSVERSAELCTRVAQEGFFPIFINWQSALAISYGNHLFHIRQGEDWREGALSTAGGYLTSPLYLAADLSRAIVRAPIVTFSQIRNDLETVPQFRPAVSLWSGELPVAQETAFTALCQRPKAGEEFVPSDAFREYATLLGKQDLNCGIHGIEQDHELAGINLSIGLDQRKSFEKNWAFAKYFLTLPTKLVTAPIIDAGGTSAWGIMLRSVSQLFHYDGEPLAHNNVTHARHNGKTYKSNGSLYLFFEKLRNAVCGDPTEEGVCRNPDGWEITLVGHSTGAIIIHHVVREFGELPIKNIVYMGAASSIRDYQETVFPFLSAKNKDVTNGQCRPERGEQKPTCVYHLMLHEAAESGEWLWDSIDPFPRGSLLIWLDNFLSHPLSKEDRTLGRFTNFITTVHHTPPYLRRFIHAQKFGVGETLQVPKKHGDFSHKLKFWDPDCWGPWPASNTCYSPEGHY